MCSSSACGLPLATLGIENQIERLPATTDSDLQSYLCTFKATFTHVNKRKKGVQMLVNDKDDVVGHGLPVKAKKKKKKHPHDLMLSVQAGRAAERKH